IDDILYLSNNTNAQFLLTNKKDRRYSILLCFKVDDWYMDIWFLHIDIHPLLIDLYIEGHSLIQTAVNKVLHCLILDVLTSKTSWGELGFSVEP
ncbi:hypothetical protein ACJX0J_036690, partial [Zea mays]